MKDKLVEHFGQDASVKVLSFEEEGVETLGSELKDRIDVYSRLVARDRRSIESDSLSLSVFSTMERAYGDYQYEVEAYASKIGEKEAVAGKHRAMLEYLQGLTVSESGRLSDVTFNRYRMEYRYLNKFGMPKYAVSHGRFNTDGELVAIKYGDDSDWVLFGKFYSIPMYYELQ